MKVINGLNNFISKDRSVVTLGVFDGVHLGHQKIIKTAIKKARSLKRKSIALTFEPHPLEILETGDKPPLLTDLAIKTGLIAPLGVDFLLVADFTKAFASISAADFVKDILVDQLHAACVVVGEDYRFGHKGQGDLFLLEELGSKFNFEVVKVPLERFQDDVISSTRIRSALENGFLEEAVSMLGHYPILAGKVISGLAHGAKVLGYPTANLELEDNLVIPKNGVYACFSRLDGMRKPAVANIGYSPTFRVEKLRIEVHILEFDGNIKGQRMEIELVKRLRDEKEYSDQDDLAEQIRLDIDSSRRILEAGEKSE